MTLQEITSDNMSHYNRLQQITLDYKKLHEIPWDWKSFQEITLDCKRLYEITRDYKTKRKKKWQNSWAPDYDID